MSRLRYIGLGFVLSIALGIVLFLCAWIEAATKIYVGVCLGVIAFIVSLYYGLKLAWLRLEDSGVNHWWVLLALVPLVNTFFVMYCSVAPTSWKFLQMNKSNFRKEILILICWLLIWTFVGAIILQGEVSIFLVGFVLNNLFLGTWSFLWHYKRLNYIGTTPWLMILFFIPVVNLGLLGYCWFATDPYKGNAINNY